MATHAVKQNDTKPLTASLRDARGVIDLTGASVKFAMRQREGAKTVTGPCTIVEAKRGEVRFEFGPQDLDTPGIFEAEFEVTFEDGAIQTFPNEGYELIDVHEDIA